MTSYFLTQDKIRSSVVTGQKDTKPFSTGSLPFRFPRSFSGNGSFAGTITDSTNAPQSGVTVQLWSRIDNILVATTTTDSDGKYQFVNLPTGEMFDLIAIDPTGKWERKVSSSRYPLSGWYPDMNLRVRGRTIYNVGEIVDLTARGYGGNGTYAYSIDSVVNGLSVDATTGKITSSSLATSGTTLSFNATAADGSGKSVTSLVNISVYNDQYHSYVTSLIHFDGTNNSTSFSDQISANVWASDGTAIISSTQSKFGGTSGKFNGSSSYIVTSADQFQLTSGDFTLECWIYRNLSGNNDYLMSHRPASTTQSGWELRINTTDFIQFFFTGGSSVISTSAIPSGQWCHIAVSRQGSSLKMFLDGAVIGTSTFSDGILFSGNTFVGAASDGTAHMNGYIDELRVTKGIARYTAAFTPPTAPFVLG